MGLVIALNKGRILKECLPILASCGVEPVEHPSESRKLIFDSRCGNHRLIVTRSADVLTYVEQGVAAGGDRQGGMWFGDDGKAGKRRSEANA